MGMDVKGKQLCVSEGSRFFSQFFVENGEEEISHVIKLLKNLPKLRSLSQIGWELYIIVLNVHTMKCPFVIQVNYKKYSAKYIYF